MKRKFIRLSLWALAAFVFWLTAPDVWANGPTLTASNLGLAGVNQTGTSQVSLQGALANGLAGGQIEVQLPGPLAQVTALSFNSKFEITNKDDLNLPSARITLRFVDLNGDFQSGGSRVEIATLTIKALDSGAGPIILNVLKLEDLKEALFTPSISNGLLTVTEVGQPPTLNFSVNPAAINPGQTSTLTWSSTNVTACTAAGGWSGPKPITGSASVSPSQTASYSLICTGDRGEVNNSVTVGVAVKGNSPPELAHIGNKVVSEGQLLVIKLLAADPDNSPLTFSANSLPTGAVFDPQEGQFFWTPNPGQAGNYTVTFRVSDGSLEDSETLVISVGEVNRPPSFVPIGDRRGQEGAPLTFTVAATDPDNDPLIFTVTNLPQGAIFEAAKRVFRWLPVSGQAGAYKVVFSVTDGSLFAKEVVAIMIESAAAAKPVLFRVVNDPKVYAVEGGRRYLIPSPAVFQRRGYQWERVKIISETELKAYGRISLVKAPADPRVYYITQAGLIRHIGSPAVFISYGNKWEDIVEIPAAELLAYPVNNLIKLERGYKVYLLQNGVKRWIKTAAAFIRRGYRWQDIAPVNQTELNSYPEGAAIK